MVHLGLMKGKFRRIVDKYHALAQCIGIIALTLDQFEPGLGSGLLHTGVRRVRHAARKAEKTAVFWSLVLWIDTI